MAGGYALIHNNLSEKLVEVKKTGDFTPSSKWVSIVPN
jgi:hypothetical protein